MQTASLVVQLFELGLHGAALVFLWLGYRLNNELNEQNATAPAEIEVLKLKLRQLRFFMVLSLAFFVIGAGLEIYQVRSERLTAPAPAVDLVTYIQPKTMPEGFPSLEVRIAGKALEFPSGRNHSTLSQAADLMIDAEPLRDAIVNMRSTLTSLQVAQAKTAAGVGLAADPAVGSAALSNADLASKSPDELQAAVARLEESLATGTSGPDSAEERAAFKTSLGWTLFVQGDNGKAKAELEEAILLAKNNATRERARNNLSVVYLNEGHLDASENLLRQNPSSPFAQRNLEAIKQIRASAKAKLASELAGEATVTSASSLGGGP